MRDGHLDQMECQLGGISPSADAGTCGGRSGRVDVPGATTGHADRSSGLPSGTSQDVVCVALPGERSSRASGWPPSPLPLGGCRSMARVGRKRADETGIGPTIQDRNQGLTGERARGKSGPREWASVPERHLRVARVAYDLGSTTLVTTQRCFPILRSRTNPSFS
jgi:hypothetical protein